MYCVFFFQAEDGIRDLVRSRGLGDVYKRQTGSGAGRALSQGSPGEDAPSVGRAISAMDAILPAVSYTHLTLPTIYSV